MQSIFNQTVLLGRIEHLTHRILLRSHLNVQVTPSNKPKMGFMDLRAKKMKMINLTTIFKKKLLPKPVLEMKNRTKKQFIETIFARKTKKSKYY